MNEAREWVNPLNGRDHATARLSDYVTNYV
jgi:hypothetical protein